MNMHDVRMEARATAMNHAQDLHEERMEWTDVTNVIRGAVRLVTFHPVHSWEWTYGTEYLRTLETHVRMTDDTNEVTSVINVQRLNVQAGG